MTWSNNLPQGTVHFDNNEIGESFDREKFAVTTVTSEDSPEEVTSEDSPEE